MNSDKHLPKSPFTGQFFQITTFCFVVYKVNKSKVETIYFRTFTLIYDKIQKPTKVLTRVTFFKTKRFCIAFNKSYPSTLAALWYCIVDIPPQMNNHKKHEKNK